MTEFSDLSIAVIHHKTPQLLYDCLTRLSHYADGAKLLVVDTDSRDDSEVMLRRDFPQVRFIHAANHSMAQAANVGLKAGQTRFIAHMNADVMIETETFGKLLEVLSSSKVGLVGPRCFTPEGNWQDQGLPYRLHYALLEHLSKASLAVPWLAGCLQVTRRDVLKRVGGLNASLRFYNEDIEWCWRMRHAGYACHLVKTDLLHIGGSSTPGDKRFLIEGFRGGYMLSKMYRPRWLRQLHRLAVLSTAAWQRRFATEAQEREAYKQIYEMFRRNRFDISPFGETLTTSNPEFLAD